MVFGPKENVYKWHRNITGVENKVVFKIMRTKGLWRSIPTEVVGAKKPQPKTPSKPKLLFCWSSMHSWQGCDTLL